MLSIRLIWSNYDKPIIDFAGMLPNRGDDSNIFFPLNHFLTFPTTSRVNCVGVTMWLFVLNRLIDIISNKIKNYKPTMPIVEDLVNE